MWSSNISNSRSQHIQVKHFGIFIFNDYLVWRSVYASCRDHIMNILLYTLTLYTN